jgi:argininosuccinate lyase
MPSQARLDAGGAAAPSDEDVPHADRLGLLHDEIGDVASKLHTGRSRNDQVSTAARLWTIDVCQQLDVAVRGLQSVMLEQARTPRDGADAVVHAPAARHPRIGAHWLLSHFWPLERDRARLRAAHHSAAVLPLGSGRRGRMCRIRSRVSSSRGRSGSTPSRRTRSTP